MITQQRGKHHHLAISKHHHLAITAALNLSIMSVAGTVRVVRKPLTSRFAAKAPITLTPAAVSRLNSLMGGSKDKYEGIRLDVKSRGCGGNSFTLDYAEKKERSDEVVEADGNSPPPPLSLSLSLLAPPRRDKANLASF
jgi:hypothetical protein